MKTSYRTILVLAMAAVLSTTALYCRAAEDVNKEEVKSPNLSSSPRRGVEKMISGLKTLLKENADGLN